MATSNPSIDYDASEMLVRLGDGGVLDPNAARLPLHRFEEVARARPDLPALVCGRQELTYTQLDSVRYTSGSTGRPKGVMVEHRSLAGFVHWGLSNFSADELDAVLASTSLGFDISILELLVPLAIGGRVVLVENLLALGAPLEVEVTLV